MIKLSYKHYLILIVSIYFLLFLFTGLFRHWGFLTTINDTGNFDQAIWGVIHEGYLHTTNIANQPMSRLAGHFDPILYAFVPFYAVYPSVAWLIGAQALALSLAAWPIFLLGSRVFQSEKIGFWWAVAFLVNPFVLNAGAWDFHPITLAVPFIALAMLAIEQKNFRLLLLSVFFILLCKEHLGVMVAGFGLLWLYKNRQWGHAALLMLIGTIHAYLVLIVIMPSLSISGKTGAIGRYAWLGESFGEIIQTIIFQPLFVLETVLITMGGAGYLLLLLLPLLGFSLLGLPALFPAAADLAANMLSANPMPRSPIAYHSATLIPIFMAAAMYGMRNIARWQQRFSVLELSLLVVIASTLMGYGLAPFPLPGAKNVWDPTSFVSWPDTRTKEIQDLLGDDAAISVQANVGGHFSQRREIYRFPNRLDQVDAVVLHLDSPTANIHTYKEDRQEQRQFIIGILDGHLQMDRNDYLMSIEELLEDQNLGLLYWSEPWLVLQKGLSNQDYSEVKAKIEKLRRNF